MNSRFDKMGALVSILCVIHCAAMPLLLFFVPALSTLFIADEALVHQLLFVLVVLVAMFSFIPGYRLHRQTKPLAFFAAGLVGLALATFLHGNACGHEGHIHEAHSWESFLAIPSSILIVMAHYFNHQSCKHSCGEHSHAELDNPAGNVILAENTNN